MLLITPFMLLTPRLMVRALATVRTATLAAVSHLKDPLSTRESAAATTSGFRPRTAALRADFGGRRPRERTRGAKTPPKPAPRLLPSPTPVLVTNWLEDCLRPLLDSRCP